MSWQFSKHYTREQARDLLPQIRAWLANIEALRQKLHSNEGQMLGLLEKGHDIGGPLANDWVRGLVQVKDIVAEFESREIQIKDLERGLIDFPAFIGGKEVFLCWEKDDEDIEFWHDLDSGYAGRERIP